MHGHTYTIHSKITGTLDSHGIILDFEIIKNALREVIVELDHKLIVPTKNKQFKVKNKDDIWITIDEKEYKFPSEDVVLVEIESATAEALAGYILKKLLSIIDIPKNVTSIEIGIDEGWGQGAWVMKKFS